MLIGIINGGYFGGLAGLLIGGPVTGLLGLIFGGGIGLIVGGLVCWFVELVTAPGFAIPKIKATLTAKPNPAKAGQPCEITLAFQYTGNTDNALCDVTGQINTTGVPAVSPAPSSAIHKQRPVLGGGFPGVYDGLGHAFRRRAGNGDGCAYGEEGRKDRRGGGHRADQGGCSALTCARRRSRRLPSDYCKTKSPAVTAGLSSRH
jgi:hypothetical protein